jgi:hypothetical protein
LLVQLLLCFFQGGQEGRGLACFNGELLLLYEFLVQGVDLLVQLLLCFFQQGEQVGLASCPWVRGVEELISFFFVEVLD